MAHRVGLARLGLASSVLGLAVEPDEKRLLYLASDRPTQARRSFHRMVGEEHRELLESRLVIWRGGLPFSILKNPEGLAVMAADFGCGTVIIDSLKDIAPTLSNEETGNAVKDTMSLCCFDGVEVVPCITRRKASGENKKPKSLDDVYGSTWITAGAGSVLLLWDNRATRSWN